MSDRPSDNQPDRPTGRGAERARLGLLDMAKRVVLAALVVGGSFAFGVRSARRFENGPRTYLPWGSASNLRHGTQTKRLVAELQRSGIIVRPNVRDSIDAMARWWDQRSDLQQHLSKPDGSPDIGKLISWAEGTTDASAVSLTPYQGGIAELKGRMGFVSPDTPDITRTLFWMFANRKDPKIAADGVVEIFAEFWRTRPEERSRFIAEGRLQLAPLLFWGFSLPSTDPSYALFGPIAFQLEQLPTEFGG